MSIETDDTVRIGKPQPSPRLQPLSYDAHKLIFGSFTFHPSPQPGNPEHVTIDAPWPEENLVQIKIPQLPGRISTLHKLVKWQFSGLFQAWQDAGLLPLVLSFDGGWASRFKRGRSPPPYGTEYDLSRHAHGTAFDINARWNPLGHMPLAASAYGTTTPLVEIANRFGWAWGGDFHGRCDPMHFEVAKLMNAEPKDLPPP